MRNRLMKSGADLKNIVYVPSDNEEQSVAFYTSELGLFEFAEDLGMGYILLRRTGEGNFYLMLSPGMAINASGGGIFSIGVADCDKEFFRLRRVAFSNGAGIAEASGVFEYPLGKFLTLRDPAGNVFSLCEWYI